MALVKWTTPKVVRRHEWETAGKPLLFKMAWFWVKWLALLGLPTLWAVWQFAPFALRQVSTAMLIMPASYFLLTVAFYIVTLAAGQPCRVDSKGLLYPLGKEQRYIGWHQMQAWAVTDHPRITGIRVLTVKAMLMRRPRTLTFPFNPRTTDEARLRQMFAEHVRA